MRNTYIVWAIWWYTLPTPLLIWLLKKNGFRDCVIYQDQDVNVEMIERKI